MGSTETPGANYLQRTEWNVRDMTAHQAGAYASGTGYPELIHQYIVALKPGQLAEDAINRRQLADRAARSPAELIAEIKQDGDKAVHNWAYGFRLLKPLGTPHPAVGWLGMRYLMLVIHSRDTWIHRLDICRATGREFEQTREHDGRIAGLVMLDVADNLLPDFLRQLHPILAAFAIGWVLAGTGGWFPAGYAWTATSAPPWTIWHASRRPVSFPWCCARLNRPRGWIRRTLKIP